VNGLFGLLPFLACAFFLGIVLADLAWLDVPRSVALGAVALLAGVRASRPHWRALCAVALFAAAGGLALSARLDEARQPATWVRSDATVEATVCNLAEGRHWVALELCDARTVWDERGVPKASSVPRRLRWTTGLDRPEAKWLAARLPGDRIRARLRVRPLAEVRNPGERDRLRPLERRGVGGRASLTDPLLRVRLPQRDRMGPARLFALATRAPRARIARRLDAAGPGGALLAALAVGDRRALSDEDRDAFYVLGVGHLLAVSGLHLALAAGLAYASSRRLLLRFEALSAARDVRLLALLIALLCAIAYALLAGWEIPVRRSLVLLVALVWAFAAGRTFSPGHALAGAALVIAVAEPWVIFEPRAQLSFAASAALLLAAPVAVIAARDVPAAPIEKLQPGAGTPHWLDLARSRWTAIALAWRAVLGTSATAFLATAPIAVAHGGGASPVALAANALMVPWTGLVLLPLSLASAALAALPPSGPASTALEFAAGIGGGTLSAVSWAADFAPRSGVASAPAGWVLAVAAGVALFGFTRRSLWTRVALAFVLALGLRAAPGARIPPGPPRIVALDVGLGDAVLVQGVAAAVLVDGGWASPDGKDLGASVVVPALRALGVEALDLVVATHADADHQGGLRAVLQALPVARLWLPPGGKADPAFAELVAQARRRGVAVDERSAADPALDLGDLHIAPVWPPLDWRGSSNERSLVLRIEVAGRSVLLSGDLGGKAERALLESAAELRSEVVKIGHHGSRTSASSSFLRAVDSRVALVSAPCGRQALPSIETLDRLRAAGQAIWWTGRDGAVFVQLAPELVVWGWAERLDAACE